MTWTFYVEEQPQRMFRKRLHILRSEGRDQHRLLIAKPLEFLEADGRGMAPEENCLIADAGYRDHSVQAFLQSALDAAWEQGLRPTGHHDHTNELAAVRAHLDDMRTIVGTKLKVPLMFAVNPAIRPK